MMSTDTAKKDADETNRSNNNKNNVTPRSFCSQLNEDAAKDGGRLVNQVLQSLPAQRSAHASACGHEKDDTNNHHHDQSIIEHILLLTASGTDSSKIEATVMSGSAEEGEMELPKTPGTDEFVDQGDVDMANSTNSSTSKSQKSTTKKPRDEGSLVQFVAALQQEQAEAIASTAAAITETSLLEEETIHTSSTTTTARAAAMATTMEIAAEEDQTAAASTPTHGDDSAPAVPARSIPALTGEQERVSDTEATATTSITDAAQERKNDQHLDDNDNNNNNNEEDAKKVVSSNSLVAPTATLIQQQQQDQVDKTEQKKDFYNSSETTANHPIETFIVAAESYDAEDEGGSPHDSGNDDDDDLTGTTDDSGSTTSGTEDGSSLAISAAAVDHEEQQATAAVATVMGRTEPSIEDDTQQTATTETETTTSIAPQDESTNNEDQDNDANVVPDDQSKEKDGLKMPFIYYSSKRMIHEDISDDDNDEKDGIHSTSSSSSDDDSRGPPNIMDDSSLSSRESFAEHERKQRGTYSILIPYGGSADYNDYTDKSIAATNHGENKSASTPDLDPIEMEQQQKIQQNTRDSKDAPMTSLEAQSAKQKADREQTKYNIATAIIITAVVAVFIWLIVVILDKHKTASGAMDNNNDDNAPRSTFAPSSAPSKVDYPDALPLPWTMNCSYETNMTSSYETLVGNDCGTAQCADSVCHADPSCCLNSTNVWNETCIARACNDPSCGACPLKRTDTPCTEVVDLVIEITLDQYPQETTWKVTRVDTGSILAVGGPYAGMPSASISETVTGLCLDGCYSFTMYDSQSDGICCVYGEGDYNLVFDGESLLPATGNGEFDASYQRTFFGGGC